MRALEAWGVNPTLDRATDLGKTVLFADLPPARYRVSVEAGGLPCALADPSKGAGAGEATVDLASNATDLRFAVSRPESTLRGKLTAAADPDARYLVLTMPVGPKLSRIALNVAFPDGEGRFEMKSLTGGRYRAAVVNAGSLSRLNWMQSLNQGSLLEIVPGRDLVVELARPKI
jgi:hypothetical protein